MSKTPVLMNGANGIFISLICLPDSFNNAKYIKALPAAIMPAEKTYGNPQNAPHTALYLTSPKPSLFLHIIYMAKNCKKRISAPKKQLERRCMHKVTFIFMHPKMTRMPPAITR